MFIILQLLDSVTTVIFFLQARGPKKHLKRLAAPKSWMLDKLGGVFAPRPSTGPHKLRESLPMVVFLRNRLKYALNNSEVTKIDKTGEFFRLVYDVKGRFAIHRITAEEAQVITSSNFSHSRCCLPFLFLSCSISSAKSKGFKLDLKAFHS